MSKKELIAPQYLLENAAKTAFKKTPKAFKERLLNTDNLTTRKTT